MQALGTTGGSQRPLALVHACGRLDRQHFACNMISPGKCPINIVGSMRTQASVSSELGRRIRVVLGNVRNQLAHDKGRRRVPMLRNEQVGFN